MFQSIICIHVCMRPRLIAYLKVICDSNISDDGNCTSFLIKDDNNSAIIWLSYIKIFFFCTFEDLRRNTNLGMELIPSFNFIWSDFEPHVYWFWWKPNEKLPSTCVGACP